MALTAATDVSRGIFRTRNVQLNIDVLTRYSGGASHHEGLHDVRIRLVWRNFLRTVDYSLVIMIILLTWCGRATILGIFLVSSEWTMLSTHTPVFLIATAATLMSGHFLHGRNR